MSNTYTGFHAVEEKVRKALEGSKQHDSSLSGLTVYYSKPGPRIKKILTQAKEAGIKITETDEKTLDALVSKLPSQEKDHRGIVLVAENEKAREKNTVQLDQWLKECPQKATVLILDSVTDPHNVGAILRSADQFGADLVILPERRSASKVAENDIIARTSAGASSWVNIAVVTNLVRAAQMLKENGFWIYGADADGESLQTNIFAPKTCIVMGSEGSGIAHLLEKQCDSIVSIPTCGKIDSLNVSVASGVLLYERYRQTL